MKQVIEYESVDGHRHFTEREALERDAHCSKIQVVSRLHYVQGLEWYTYDAQVWIAGIRHCVKGETSGASARSALLTKLRHLPEFFNDHGIGI